MNNEISKTQTIRLVDVFVLGPVMVWLSTQKGPLPTWARTFLLVPGVATVGYNARNYLRQEAKR